MTQLRSDPSALSNYFDRVLAGIAPRGGSFTDVDRLDVDAPRTRLYLSQDRATGRVLVQEFKQDHEHVAAAQLEAYAGLVRLSPHISVWIVRVQPGARLDWYDVRAADKRLGISEEQYRALYRQWWHPPPVRAAEIRW